MCGRYSFVPNKVQLEDDLPGVEIPAQIRIRFNIAPTDKIYVVANDKPHTMQVMAWGLLPSWSKDAVLSGKMINARAEGIEQKPSFRDPIRRRRCVVPADSFYEWRTEAGNRKAPYRILNSSGHLLLMAGIWDEWSKGAVRLRTVSIITTTPNQEISSIHNRMPVVLSPEDVQKWLAPIDLHEVLDMLKPPGDGVFKMYRVSDKLNHVGYEGEDLHEEIPEQPTLF